MTYWLKRMVIILILAHIGVGFYLAFQERPLPVDMAEVTQGPMQVVISEEGVTRVRDVYTISAPITGLLTRSALDEGQQVKTNDTIIASIHPVAPAFLDERTRNELQSALDAARSALSLAMVENERANMALELARSDHDRAVILARKKVLPLSQLERTDNALKLRRAEVKSSLAAIEVRKAEVVSAEARLKQPQEVNPRGHNDTCCVQIRSPIDGVVLKVLEKSENTVAAGTRLAEIGNPRQLEIVVGLLSRDATRIREGDTVSIAEWGHDKRLSGTVRRIDPTGFTKVSSLGIEEQRVNAIVDLATTPDVLGHGFRVIADFVIWKGDNVLQVPIGALFRTAGNWSVYTIADHRARLRSVEVGKMTDETVQIMGGLKLGDRVVQFPNDKLEDGRLVEQR